MAHMKPLISNVYLELHEEKNVEIRRITERTKSKNK